MMLPDELLLYMFRTRNEAFGRPPNTAEMARVLECSEADVANAIMRARDAEYVRRQREQREWDEARHAQLRALLARQDAARAEKETSRGE